MLPVVEQKGIKRHVDPPPLSKVLSVAFVNTAELCAPICSEVVLPLGVTLNKNHTTIAEVNKDHLRDGRILLKVIDSIYDDHLSIMYIIQNIFVTLENCRHPWQTWEIKACFKLKRVDGWVLGIKVDN